MIIRVIRLPNESKYMIYIYGSDVIDIHKVSNVYIDDVEFTDNEAWIDSKMVVYENDTVMIYISKTYLNGND